MDAQVPQRGASAEPAGVSGGALPRAQPVATGRWKQVIADGMWMRLGRGKRVVLTAIGVGGLEAEIIDYRVVRGGTLGGWRDFLTCLRLRGKDGRRGAQACREMGAKVAGTCRRGGEAVHGGVRADADVLPRSERGLAQDKDHQPGGEVHPGTHRQAGVNRGLREREEPGPNGVRGDRRNRRTGIPRKLQNRFTHDA